MFSAWYYIYVIPRRNHVAKLLIHKRKFSEMLGREKEETKLILPLGPHNHGPFQKSILLVNLTVG